MMPSNVGAAVGYQGTQAVEAARDSQVVGKLSQLADSITAMNAQMDKLEQRLRPVLRSQPPNAENNCKPVPAEMLCPMAEHLQMLYDQLGAVHRVLAVIHQHLEV